MLAHGYFRVHEIDIALAPATTALVAELVAITASIAVRVQAESLTVSRSQSVHRCAARTGRLRAAPA